MPAPQKFKCNQCGMKFPADQALSKHQTRFCIGTHDSGIGRQLIDSDGAETDTTIKQSDTNYSERSTGKKAIQHKSSLKKKQAEVDEWKQQRAILQRIEDLENRILNDHYKTQKMTENTHKETNTYNEIFLEYERLRTQEQDVLRHMYDLHTASSAVKNSNTQAKQMNDLTDKQKNQFEELQRKNHRFEQERRIIQKKLEELIATNSQPSIMSTYEPHRLLREMKEQQEINEKALEFLRGRLYYSNAMLSTASDVPSLPYLNNTRSGRSRQNESDNVRNFRQGYLHSGGHDARMIARYSDLEYSLRSSEHNPWSKDHPEPLRQARYQSDSHMDSEVKQFELATEENRRLKDELHEIRNKFEMLDKRTKQLELSMTLNGVSNSNDHQRRYQSNTDLISQSHPSSYENSNDYKYQSQFQSKTELPSAFQTSARENHYEQTAQSRTFNQTSLPYLDKRLTPRASPTMNLLDSHMSRLRDPFAPQPYDPTGGLVIFFDFILNLPSAIEYCCLVTCLHHPKSGLGEPSVLDPINCEDYTDDRTGERMHVALVATKQPVIRCPPQQALTVIVEVRTSTNKQMPSEQLQTNALVKLPLFDNKNRLASGRWKIPLKASPVDHNESLAVLSTRPSYERAELYYRLVNSQDSDDQSNTPLSPSIRHHYTYPLQLEGSAPMIEDIAADSEGDENGSIDSNNK